MNSKKITDLVLHALNDMKAQDIRVLDIGEISTITEVMVIATGTSTRHVRGIADNLTLEVKKAGEQPLGIEGEQGADWVLIDLGDVVVHIMLQQTRDFYNLEKLWDITANKSDEDLTEKNSSPLAN